ncbi:hypothetical protein B0T22DRAFT_61235 [Podospora appendiculata]|uniref:BHLH domain-containing protein n=1 Tax=Podospora appendiculata TaxID=314037 RepID=A0AAE0XII6_9PEZI|nr:hypothetical protein B0T22DRAFT_61235 [Podospora appendiculata]
MPRATGFPPTPGSSTDIKGQDGSKQASLQNVFELPPPAISSSSNASNPKSSGAPGNVFPTQPSETVKARRRSSAVVQSLPKDQFTLPPPPTRSRKIIQMKPREDPPPETRPPAPKAAASASTSASASASKNITPAAPSPATAGSKRKQPSATSAAGRKIARKTAHSLIERRRRSKMNEEFALLKDMIPACTGEMHKLAILQASIEYVRYLEDCVAQLKAHREPPEFKAANTGLPSPSGGDAYNPDRSYDVIADMHSPDVEMTGSEMPSPASTANPGRSQQPSISPALMAADARDRNNSYSSASTADHRRHRYSGSAATSPAFGPQLYGYAHSTHSTSGSALTSPALNPQADLDQEATAALLMLNQTDRRHSTAAGPGRGMSVRDLLST